MKVADVIVAAPLGRPIAEAEMVVPARLGQAACSACAVGTTATALPLLLTQPAVARHSADAKTARTEFANTVVS
jgi:hypothetical protein